MSKEKDGKINHRKGISYHRQHHVTNSSVVQCKKRLYINFYDSSPADKIPFCSPHSIFYRKFLLQKQFWEFSLVGFKSCRKGNSNRR